MRLSKISSTCFCGILDVDVVGIYFNVIAIIIVATRDGMQKSDEDWTKGRD